MKFKVYEVEARTTTTGKEMKKLVLQGEGKQYPDKGVTMWSDHPLFNTIAAGQEIEAELDVKDSQTPNPKGGFYKNKTVLKPGSSPRPTAAPSQNTSDWGARTHNAIELKVIPMLHELHARLDRIEKFVTGDAALDEAFKTATTEEKQSDDESIPF